MHFRLPITHDLSAPFDFLYEGSGIAASIEAAELITGRPLMWITTQFLPNTRPGTVVDLDVVTPVAGRATSLACGVNGHSLRTAASLAFVADILPLGICIALGRPLGGTSLDNSLRVVQTGIIRTIHHAR